MPDSAVPPIPPADREAMLFTLTLERPPAERPALLDLLCLGEPVLRARIEALLAVYAADDPLLASQLGRRGEEVKAVRQAVTTRLALADEPADEAVGQTLGRYKLLEKVGEGGCGVVYVAEQTEPVRRRVALKVIKLGMDTKQVVARFEAERQALALMDHPNIAKVFDAGTTEKGRPYFVMELVRGIPITHYCDQNNLSTQARVDLFIKVCYAVQHAHQKGIIHRDIKPSNILVTVNDGVPVPKVIDFGIAKATEGRLTDHTVYTQLHQFIGTPAYMSPEQAEMTSLDIDTRSDIYSLGVLLYELLSGRTPFDARELMAAGLDAMRKAIREQEPERPSTRFATLLGDELSTTAKRRAIEAPKLVNLLKGDLDWIVMKALEKDRTRRYDTANGLAADLKRHLDNEPVLARPPSAAYRFQKAWRRNRTAFAVIVLVAVVLIVATAVSLWLALFAARERSRAEMRLSIISRLYQRSSKVRFAEEAPRLMEEVLAFRRKVNGPEHPDSLRAMHQLADYNREGRDYWKARDLLEKLLPLSRKEFGAEHSQTLNAMFSLADCYYCLGQHSDAVALAKQVWATPSDTNTWFIKLDVLPCLCAWEVWFDQQADYDVLRRQAIDWATGMKSANATDSAAKVYCLRPSTDSALLAQALALAQQAVELGENTVEQPWFQCDLGLAQYRNGRYPEAEQALKLAEQKAIAPFPPEDCERVKQTSQLLRAMSLWRQQHIGEARKLFLETETQMPPLPQDVDNAFADGKRADHDLLIEWLIYKEAKALLNEPAAKP